MAIGDALRLARADIAKQRLQVNKELGGISDLLLQFGQQAGRKTAAEATAAEREAFQTERGDIFAAIEAGTATTEQRRRGFELGLIRPEAPRPEELEQEPTSQQRLNRQVADLERKVLEGTATETDKASLARFRASRRVPERVRPLPAAVEFGRKRFVNFETQLAQNIDVTAEERQVFVPQVGSLIIQSGFEDPNAGFFFLMNELDDILPDVRTVTREEAPFLGFFGGGTVTETDPLDDSEKLDLAIKTKNAILELRQMFPDTLRFDSALTKQRQELAKQIGEKPAKDLIDFLIGIGN